MVENIQLILDEARMKAGMWSKGQEGEVAAQIDLTERLDGIETALLTLAREIDISRGEP